MYLARQQLNVVNIISQSQYKCGSVTGEYRNRNRAGYGVLSGAFLPVRGAQWA
jgi:hypothetical protein